MKFLVYFKLDKQFIACSPHAFLHPKLERECVESWSSKEWNVISATKEDRVGICEYDGTFYEDTYLIQVVNDDQAEIALCLLRRLKFEKKKKIDNLLKEVPLYTCASRRLTYPPLKNIRTDSGTGIENVQPSKMTSKAPAPCRQSALKELPALDFQSSVRVTSPSRVTFPRCSSPQSPPHCQQSSSSCTQSSFQDSSSLRASPSIPTKSPFRSPMCPNVVSMSPRSGRCDGVNERLSIGSTNHENLSQSAVESGYESHSTESTSNFLSAIMKELGNVTSTLYDLVKRVGVLEGRILTNGVGFPGTKPDLDFPLYKSVEDLKKPVPSNLVKWFLWKGGKNASDHVAACIDLVMTKEIQLQVNQTGVRGKEAFPKDLRAVIFASTESLFKGVTEYDIKGIIRKRLSGASDRDGGRMERRLAAEAAKKSATDRAPIRQSQGQCAKRARILNSESESSDSSDN